MYAESPCIRRIDPGRTFEFSIPPTLLQSFPGKVQVIPRGSTLYHFSYSLDKLLATQRFDYLKSHHNGAFYFTDLPIDARTNCQVEIERDLIMFSFGDLSGEDLNKLQRLGQGNFWEGGRRLGFDGRTFRNPDALARIAEGVFATEVVIFRTGLPKLGVISSHPVNIYIPR